MKRCSKYILLACLAFASFNQKLQAQNYTLGLGIGIPEFVSLEASIQGNPIEFKVGIGGLPIPDDKLFALHGDIAYHFGKFDDDIDMQQWFGRVGLAYYKEETERWIDQYGYLNVRIGRLFSFNESWGMEVDLGLLFEIYYERTELQSTTTWFNIDFPVLPALGLRVFYYF